ncbi:PREDICTED: probable transcriptional regulatory protein pdtaR [Cyphomyrmex costatus]|uniref:probable transcriptional regulatory protein pdtaR n=1 Tax=Cyphomyrmex costatus TaxID=456900 RepID=UPI0008523C3B|nr:PREDICTED: probable transcriptional regulatory protein pdtaR [Cyphomyrmex costatus]
MDIAMPTVDGIEAASQITAAHVAPVVMLTAFSQRALIERASAAGAMAYLVKPFVLADLIPAIELARSRFAELTDLHSQVDELSEQLATRKLVERAKSILQQAHGLSEPDAFSWIQRAAMDKRMSMKAVAGIVIAEADRADG